MKLRYAAPLLLPAGWALIENTALLCVKSYAVQIPAFPRTVVLSDLHKRRFGKDNVRLVRRIQALHPELILIAGDLISRTERNFKPTACLLHRLRAIAPVIAVPGNHEVDLPDSLYALLRRIMQAEDVILLENRTVLHGGVRFAGLTLPRAYYRGGGLLGFRGKYDCTPDLMQTLLGTCEENTVLLAHNPLFFPAYAQWGAALTLSGHVHGGMVRLPFVGGLFSPERTLLPKYDKGYFTDGDHAMIVSGGLGKLRFNNPPELLLLTASA